MNILTFNYGNVKFSAPEYPLIDTFRFRVPYVSSPRRAFDRYEIDKTAVLVNRRRPSQSNGWHGYNDIQTSVAKYLGGGENNQVEFNDYRRRDYRKHHTAIFTALQADIGTHSGINFNIFDSHCSRYHVALNLQCDNRQDAERLRDYWFESVNLRYLPNKHKHKNSCYWNCKSYDGSQTQPNQTFVIYPTGKNKLRLEYRRNDIASVRGMLKSSLAASLKLEHSFGSLSQPKAMNGVFWHTARHFFTAEDKEKIFGTVGAYS